MPTHKVVVAGGGAAGIFAAIACAEKNPDCEVIVLEKGKEVLTKVKVSGGGRCNVTHACYEPKELVKNYPRGHRELLGPFHKWQPGDTIEWFESRGVPLKTEADGRMFPTTDKSQSVIDCLLGAAEAANITIRKNNGLAYVDAKPDNAGFWLTLDNGDALECERLLIASGGLRSTKAASIATHLGHTIEPLAPSLFTFHINDSRLKGLAGLSVENVELNVSEIPLQSRGPLLITHWGTSGPATLKLSAWGARALNERNYQFELAINWLPQESEHEIHKRLQALKKKHPRRHVKSANEVPLPQRLWERLVQAANIDDDVIWATLSKAQMQALCRQIHQGEFQVTRKSMNKEEFVTCGGIRLKEINFKTMESRICPNLHFAGESLDIDGITGGFNFQAAWTTGMLAGLAMAKA